MPVLSEQTPTHLLFDNISMGQFVDVEIQNHLRDRFKSYIVGAKDKQYLIFEQPDVKKYGYVRDQLEDGVVLVVRTICEKTTGECLAFRTELKGVNNHPYKLLFVNFPDEIQMRELRRERRQYYRHPAQIFTVKHGSRMSGLITDISAGGCRFELEVDDGVRGIKQEYVQVELMHPDDGRIVEVTAKVCSQRKQHKTISIGLAFEQQLQLAS